MNEYTENWEEFDNWFDELKKIALEKYGLDYQMDLKKAWNNYFTGYSPEEAIEKDLNDEIKEEFEEKFIVINKKHFRELNDLYSTQDENHPAVDSFLSALRDFKDRYEIEIGKPLNQKYYVVNQDEPYADNIIKFILDNEQNEKE